MCNCNFDYPSFVFFLSSISSIIFIDVRHLNVKKMKFFPSNFLGTILWNLIYIIPGWRKRQFNSQPIACLSLYSYLSTFSIARNRFPCPRSYFCFVEKRREEEWFFLRVTVTAQIYASVRQWRFVEQNNADGSTISEYLLALSTCRINLLSRKCIIAVKSVVAPNKFSSTSREFYRISKFMTLHYIDTLEKWQIWE